LSKPYQPPAVETVGTVAELTEQLFNKVGNDADTFTPAIPQVVGSLTPPPS
jgi:hypothetical protein